MKFKKIVAFIIGALSVSGFITSPGAFELITATDIKDEIVVTADFIKTADNAIILFDSSSSMNKPYKNTGMTRYDIAKKTLIHRNQYFPDLGHTFGIYLYTPWKEIYPVQKYDRNRIDQALKTLPSKGSEATFLTDGLKNLDSVLKGLEGRTAVFIYTDGGYTKRKGEKSTPLALATALAEKYNVCFYLVTTADDDESMALFNKAGSYDFCSRVLAFEDFIERPAYNSEALFTVKASTDIVTVTDEKVVGIKTKNFLFAFDKADLSPDAGNRLMVLANYLKANPNAFAAMAGFTDNIGTEAYNRVLSFQRVSRVADYLIDDLNVDPSQLILFWYGQLNPIADNSTSQGQQKNRRVEIVVGGI